MPFEFLVSHHLGYAQEALQQLREAIQHLPSEEKEVFLLRQNGELTYEQIAQRHNRAVAVVKEQMRSVLRTLRTVCQVGDRGTATALGIGKGEVQRCTSG